MTIVRCVLKHPGAKWSIAAWIIAHLPAHDVYVEPFFGSGAVFFQKAPAIVEVVNDLDDQVVRFFKTLRHSPDELARVIELTPWSRSEWAQAQEASDDPLETARRLLVRAWQSHGHRPGLHGWRHNGPTRDDHSVTTTWASVGERIRATAVRLRRAQIECRPALDVLRRWRGTEVLVYADPPYLADSRANRRIYRKEMMDARGHIELLEGLQGHPGPVVLSHYRCALYDRMLARWAVRERATVAEHGRKRIEAVYLNPSAVARLGAGWLA